MHTTTGVRRRGAQVEPADRGLGAAEPGDRPEDELLVQLRRTAVERAADDFRSFADQKFANARRALTSSANEAEAKLKAAIGIAPSANARACRAPA